MGVTCSLSSSFSLYNDLVIFQEKLLLLTSLFISLSLFSRIVSVFWSLALNSKLTKEMTTGVGDGESVSLDLLRQKMADFAKERDWDKFHSPRNLLLALVRVIQNSWFISFLVKLFKSYPSVHLFIYFFCSLLVSLMMTHKRLNEDDDHTRISSFIFLCGVLKTWPKILQPKPVVLYLEKFVIDLLLTGFFFPFLN